MHNLAIREPKVEDREAFIDAVKNSDSFHYPWIKAPVSSKDFDEYLQRFNQPNHKSFLLCESDTNIIGVFNVIEIVRGLFQSAYLSFYTFADYAGKGYMSQGLKLVLEEVFNEMKLHRLEANIQPENVNSVRLVKRNGFRYEGFSPRYLNVDGKWRGHEHWAITFEDFIKDDDNITEKDYVEIVPYNSSWPQHAKAEIKKIRSALLLDQIIDIQHVGSTAIPGLSAKPIIDIQIAVKSLDETKVVAVPALQKLDYEFWQENPDSKRMFFVKGMPPFGEKRTHHIHIFEPTSKHWRGKIAFRDYLIAHPKAAEEYQHLKLKLAQEHTCDREEYTNAKEEFVNRILKLASEKN